MIRVQIERPITFSPPADPQHHIPSDHRCVFILTYTTKHELPESGSNTCSSLRACVLCRVCRTYIDGKTDTKLPLDLAQARPNETYKYILALLRCMLQPSSALVRSYTDGESCAMRACARGMCSSELKLTNSFIAFRSSIDIGLAIPYQNEPEMYSKVMYIAAS